ncbi:MAG: hypothetical protein KGD63_00785 [Candidatus Lokiarchaeota archaeon]|nr:hypothetical protein [Candidatus Lokiarchaeota archaeon]
MDWVIERIREGDINVVNPFNRTQISRVSIKPKDGKCWIW